MEKNTYSLVALAAIPCLALAILPPALAENQSTGTSRINGVSPSISSPKLLDGGETSDENYTARYTA